MRPRWLSPFLAAALPLGLFVPDAAAQRRSDDRALIVFKDGFFLRGRVGQQKDLLFDPVAKRSFSIPKAGGLFWLDDDVRRYLFSPAQMQDVFKDDRGDDKELLQFVRYKIMGERRMPGYEVEAVGKFDDKWTRVLKLNTPQGRMEVEQRLAVLTPRFARIHSVKYDWHPCYLTQELGPELVRSLIEKYYADKKDVTEFDKRLTVCRFFHQAGWLDHAAKELEALANDFPDQKSAVVPLQDTVKKLGLTLQAEALEKLHAGGRHAEARARLEAFLKEGFESEIGEKLALRLHDLRAKYRKADEDMKQARRFLADLPARADPSNKFFADAAAAARGELHLDGLARLETFLQYAAQHQRDLDQGRKPGQTADEVLALAVSGWLLGNAAAETDVKLAGSLWKARQTILEYQKTFGLKDRARLADALVKDKLGADVVARLIRLLPPPEPHDKLDPKAAGPLRVDITLPDSVAEGSYLVQVPPEYNPHRAYPVVVLLHSGREKPEEIVARWREPAARHGYLLMAPLWGRGIQPSYGYTAAEHALVLDALRDLRRRFQVDSDRVFLFGWEAGAQMAWDVGLSHPDQFAGVIPMNGGPFYHPTKYWPNGQYLPFYVIEGDRNGINAAASRAVFKDWTRWHYPSLYVEYKGRGTEWFHAELDSVFDWMRRKKRAHPTRELGRTSTGVGGSGEEFKTMRETDNRFYFLSTDHVLERHLNDVSAWVATKAPATLQASIGTVNTIEGKAGGGVGGARIQNVISVRCSGVKQLSIWLTPTMIDFSKPVSVRVNNSSVGKAQVITPDLPTLLEDFYQQGDRQRLFYARIDLKL